MKSGYKIEWTDNALAELTRLNTLYYREKENNKVEILSFFSNRQNPDKRKI